MRKLRERQWRDIEASGAAVWEDEFGFTWVDGNAYLAWAEKNPPSA